MAFFMDEWRRDHEITLSRNYWKKGLPQEFKFARRKVNQLIESGGNHAIAEIRRMAKAANKSAALSLKS